MSVQDTSEVLEFTIGENRYCTNIKYIEEVGDVGETRSVPNTSPVVNGVVDLRGSVTTILDPKELFDIEGDVGEYAVIFDKSSLDVDQNIGWAVDSVDSVNKVTASETNNPPSNLDYVDAIVDRDNESKMMIWTDPQSIVDDIDMD